MDVKRSVKVEQLKMRELQVEIDGTAVTPAATGFDAFGISSVVDNGTGDYTIILKRPFNIQNSNLAKAFVQMVTPARISVLAAVAYDRVTINTFDLAGLAADADFSLLIKGCDHRFNY